LDAVFLTHEHADHVHGLDDLRPLCYEKPIPVYGNAHTIGELRERFSYIFRETQKGGGKPRIDPIVLTEPVRIGGLTISPIPVKHGVLDILGWKISETSANGNSVAAVYLTDTSSIPDTSLHLIGQPEVAIIGGLRVRAHETHFTFQQALHTALHISARQIYLTHICHEHSHQEIVDFCRAFQADQGLSSVSMGPAYDELELVLEPRSSLGG
jgi:phosphoribosyl 1,2-cyclic phosphate phosphodiesterase